MKNQLLVLAIITMCFSCGGNNNDNTSTGNTAAEHTERANNEDKSTTESSSGDGIVGEWEQEHTVLDKNGNNKLDPDERSNPSPNKIGDYYLRFNADGTCLYSEMKFEGTYEVKAEKEGQKIYITGGDPRRLEILSLDKNEMVLLPSGAPGTFLVYKRK